jgi:transcriptional regulator of acetoin/glycerol metabolism
MRAEPVHNPTAPEPAVRILLETIASVIILKRIEARGGNLVLVAKDLGISRTALWQRMRAYQIEPIITDEADISE